MNLIVFVGSFLLENYQMFYITHIMSGSIISCIESL